MAKTLSFAYESPREVKVGDDETTFTLICKNEDMDVSSFVDLTGSKSIIAKIGNRSGYLRGQLISLDSCPGLREGKIRLTFEKSTLDNFPPGLYNLEIWIIDSNGTSIYPSDNPFCFTVTSNLESGPGKTITTITFDDFVEEMNKAASTIKGEKGGKGDTGDPGPIGPQGPAGPQGTGLVVRGKATDAKTLPTSNNTNGDAYFVNTNLYVWVNNAWNNMGNVYPDLSNYTQGTMGLDFTQQDVTNIPAGYRYFDTTLNKPIWYTGTIWVDALGQPPYFTVGLSRVNMSSEINHEHNHSINENVYPTTDDAKTDETELNN